MAERVANRHLSTRVAEMLGRRGGMTSLQLTHAAYGRRSNCRGPTSAAERSAVRRALARMIRKGLVVEMGRRGGRKLYWRTVDAEMLRGLELGTLDG